MLEKENEKSHVLRDLMSGAGHPSLAWHKIQKCPFSSSPTTAQAATPPQSSCACVGLRLDIMDVDDYPGMDPYSRSRYEQGIDSKIVIMGNSGGSSPGAIRRFVLILFGATGVGKTSLLHRYTQNKFDPKNTTSTSGAFFVTKKVYVNGLKVRLQLWDTAGQERFRSMVSS